MSSSSASRGEHDRKTRCMLETLDAGNGNQQAWLDSCSSFCRERGHLVLCLKIYNESRPMAGHDFDDNGAAGIIKREPGSDADAFTPALFQEEDVRAAGAGPDAERKIHIYDALEQELVDKTCIFLDPSTGLDESQEMAKLRFKFFTQLKLSAPHHVLRTANVPEGDCHRFMSVVTILLQKHGRSRWLTVLALGEVKFIKGLMVQDVVNQLVAIAVRANRLRAASVDDDLLKGGLLHIISVNGAYQNLIDDFSKMSCNKSFQEIARELTHHEYNLSSTRAIATMPMPRMVAYSAPEGEHKTSPPTKEVCRNYLRGKCNNGVKCPRIHEPSHLSKKLASDAKAAFTGKCYNCNGNGHMAHACPKPKKPRHQQAHGVVRDANRDANTVEEFLREIGGEADGMAAGAMEFAAVAIATRSSTEGGTMMTPYRSITRMCINVEAIVCLFVGDFLEFMRPQATKCGGFYLLPSMPDSYCALRAPNTDYMGPDFKNCDNPQLGDVEFKSIALADDHGDYEQPQDNYVDYYDELSAKKGGSTVLQESGL
jgi:hypothetical protein